VIIRGSLRITYVAWPVFSFQVFLIPIAQDTCAD
jgi:hypothetical protein